jgi:hypothetical protein
MEKCVQEHLKDVAPFLVYFDGVPNDLWTHYRKPPESKACVLGLMTIREKRKVYIIENGKIEVIGMQIIKEFDDMVCLAWYTGKKVVIYDVIRYRNTIVCNWKHDLRRVLAGIICVRNMKPLEVCVEMAKTVSVENAELSIHPTLWKGDFFFFSYNTICLS